MELSSFYDVIVVGAGTMGMPTGAYLAEHGARILIIDTFDPPHHSGSHHGQTRMIRHAYGEGRQYVSLVKRAQFLWKELERQSGLKIFEQTGVLGQGHRSSPFLKETVDAAKNHHLPLEELSADEIMERWPGITVAEDFIGCLETGSGLLFSENAIQAYKNIALENHAEILTNTPVLDIKQGNSSVEVITRNGTFNAGKVVVTAGAWAGKLLSDLQLPLQPYRKVVGWFESPELFEAPLFPSFYVDEGDRMFYGFPSLDGSGLKLGRTDGGQPIDPDNHVQNFGYYSSDEGDLRGFLHKFMPHANGKLKTGITCLYTKSPDGHFIIDHHPNHQNIILACGFSGHGFKFGSVMGEVLGQLAQNGTTDHDISLFSLSRFEK
jgi:N-methyl-L-tryptophan oxidase